MTLRYSLLALGVTLVLSSGCGSGSSAGETSDGQRTDRQGKASRIDEVAGTYRGVGLRDDSRAIQRVFGQQAPASDDEPGLPLGHEDDPIYGPVAILLEDPAGGPPAQGPTYRYHDAVFFFLGTEVGAFIVVETGAMTNRGTAIGQGLEKVQANYPELECGTENKDTEYEPFPACTGEVAPARYVWFGGDPIRSISVSIKPFNGLD